MSCAAAFFIGLLIGIIVVITTFLGVYYYTNKSQQSAENYTSIANLSPTVIKKDNSYPSAVRDMPKYFGKEHFAMNDKLTKQFLKGKMKTET